MALREHSRCKVSTLTYLLAKIAVDVPHLAMEVVLLAIIFIPTVNLNSSGCRLSHLIFSTFCFLCTSDLEKFQAHLLGYVLLKWRIKRMCFRILHSLDASPGVCSILAIGAAIFKRFQGTLDTKLFKWCLCLSAWKSASASGALVHLH